MDFETRARERRLMDVARGKQYLRQIDNLAEKHWSKLSPRITNPKFVAVGPLKEYTFYLNSSFQQKGDDETNKDMFKRRIHSEQTPKPVGLFSKERIYSERPAGQISAAPVITARLFNQWGSNIDPLADKVALTKEDLKPQFEPFRFRDEMKRVQKPSPKKGVLMSRVTSETKERNIKTNTNFRSSRNGMVAIIHPVGPSPDMEVPTAAVDPQTIEREQTTMMLKRIDRMLHPNRHALKTKLAPSEEEVSHHSTPELSVNSKGCEKIAVQNVNTDTEQKKPNHSRNDSMNEAQYHTQQTTTTVNQEIRASEQHINSLAHPAYAPSIYGKPSKTLEEVLEELDSNQINVDRKCRLWIDRWVCESRE